MVYRERMNTMEALSINRKQFDVLCCLERYPKGKSQREIAELTGMSVGSVNRTVSSLTQEGMISDGSITEKGLDALEPYRVKRAIFLAAGFGSRLVPVTLNTPKPLVRVNGTRMIDTMLDAVIAAGITEIYVVRGYLGEQFDQLLYKYPMLKFIENPLYNESNNISSALAAKGLFENAYIMEADLVLYNPDLITKYQYTSNYLGVPVEKTDDWCFATKNGVITAIMVGGTNCYHEYGVSYWNEEHGKKLSQDVEAVFNMPGGRERYWDQVPLEYFAKNYRVEVRPCTFQDIIEIDSYADLKKIDKTYC